MAAAPVPTTAEEFMPAGDQSDASPATSSSRRALDSLARGDVIGALDLADAVERDPPGADRYLAGALLAAIMGDAERAWAQGLACAELIDRPRTLTEALASAMERPGLARAQRAAGGEGAAPPADPRRRVGWIRQALEAGRISDALSAAVDLVGVPGQPVEALRELVHVLDDVDPGPELVRALEQLAAASPEDLDARARLARLRLWLGEGPAAVAAARELHGQAPTAGLAARVEGAVDVLEGRPEDALPRLERALAADPGDQEAALWRVEALLRLGRVEDACEAMDRAVREGSHGFPKSVLWAHLEATVLTTEGLEGSRWRAVAAQTSRDPRAMAERYQLLFGDHLRRWVSEAEQDRLLGSAELRRDVTGRILRDLGGNRSNRPTVVEAARRGRRLVRIEPELSPRLASDAAVKSIVHRPVGEVLAELTRLTARYSDSPHPFCFRGEVKLWCGELDDALEDFLQAVSIQSVRWAHVGQAAVHVLRGDWDAAQEAFTAAASFGPVPGATTHVYLGEGHRRFGDMTEAVRQLRIAVEGRPTRVGAWINLALTPVLDGGEPGPAEGLRRARALAPALLWRAARDLDRPVPASLEAPGAREVLERCLVLLRGNRSSSIVTRVDADGVLRVMPPPGPIAALAHRARRPDGAGPEGRELARILVGAPTLPVDVAGGLRLLAVRPRGDEVDLILGDEVPRGRIRIRGTWTAGRFVAAARVVAEPSGSPRILRTLEQLAARMGRATTEDRWRAVQDARRTRS